MTDKLSSIENSLFELNKMFEISAISSNSIDMEDLISKLSDFLSDYLDTDKIYFFTLNKNVFRSVPTNQVLFKDKYFEYDNRAFFSLLQESSLVAIEDEQGGKHFTGFIEQNRLEDLEIKYLRAFFDKTDNTPLCFCFLGEDDKKINDHLSFLNRVFEYIEPALLKLMLQKEQNKKIDDLQQSLYNVSILYNISQAVNFIDDLKRLLQVILSKAIDILDAEKGSLMLYDYSSNTLQVKVVYGLDDKRVEENINNGIIQCSKIKVGEGIAGTVFLERKAIITNLGTNDPRFAVKNSPANVQSLLCVPLITKGEAIGVINISNKKNDNLFNQKDLEFMTSLANQAAIAIDNAKLYELATKDGLTKLYINRHFMTLLDNETRRCARYKHNMSLIMIDIDDFKQVNDCFGHLMGDQILREVANQISTTIRKIDIAARYGGEEFVVLLPETTKQGAAIIAERLRKNIEKICAKSSMGETINTTVSMGISQFGKDADNSKDLIDVADKALYNSKRNGKNMVSFYENGEFKIIGS